MAGHRGNAGTLTPAGAAPVAVEGWRVEDRAGGGWTASLEVAAGALPALMRFLAGAAELDLCGDDGAKRGRGRIASLPMSAPRTGTATVLVEGDGELAPE